MAYYDTVSLIVGNSEGIQKEIYSRLLSWDLRTPDLESKQKSRLQNIFFSGVSIVDAIKVCKGAAGFEQSRNCVPQLWSLDLASSVGMRRTTEIGDLKTFLIFNIPGRGLKSELGNRWI
ncbi:hypothetical protein EV44_g3541 [Erysiphe necator]|uniref:Uncharacterized protein n=1 Tax=Uncinula necator TaxID=52586 RepID=A0A0B1P7H4_UNCNE|nr:hypothetical protein EV44_g3541 [Erysiphe necator]